MWYKTPLTKIITLSAVATLALFFVVRSMLIPVSPESLFELNYQPYQAFTAVTRGDENSFSNRYNYAIINYNQGNYELATIEFELMMKNDTFKVAPFFFAGLSQIELGNYSKAIDLLTKVTTLNADYTIEAKWYLGLIYLKNGDINQAEICFKDLSSIPGFYQEKSRKLLRKLQK